MAHRSAVKTTFAPANVIQPIYTGGVVSLSQNGQILASCVNEDTLLTDFRNGKELARIEGDGESVTSLALTPSASHLILCSRSLSMRIYALRPSAADDDTIDPELLRSLKPHGTPDVTSAVDATGTLLATGGADGTVKVWDIRGGYTTHAFHGHGVVISALHFFELKEQTADVRLKNGNPNGVDTVSEAGGMTIGYRLASGDEDGKIRIWNLHKRKAVATLDSHVSVVRSLDYSSEENALVSGSRDKTIMVWDARTWKIRTTIPVLESVESTGFLTGGEIIVTGGETGCVRLWSTNTSKEITREQEPGGETEVIVDVIKHSGLPFVVSVHADQTFAVHDLAPIATVPAQVIDPLPVLRRISGTHDEIIDLAYVGSNAAFMALATNVEDVRIISLQQSAESKVPDVLGGGHFGADVGLLRGHEDIIICLDVDGSGHWLATGAKDSVAKLWKVDPENGTFECFATLTGHAESIGAISLPKTNSSSANPPKFLITGSQDKTIKRWDISAVQKSAGKAGRASYTRKAHDKDINALSMGTDASLFASASQDKTVKIWSAEDGATVGILRGHRRGVWAVSFSPLGIRTIGSTTSTKGFIVTGSGDKTVKVWSLNDYSCVQTFEGHTNSVLKTVWLPPPDDLPPHDQRGPLVASAGGDGLVKVWESASGELATTLDNHTDRVWALAAHSSGNMLVSGGGDGVITFWQDTTTTTAAEAASREIQRVEEDQRLQNLVHGGNWREAITLALQLDRPGRLLTLFQTVVESEKPDTGSLSGSVDVDEVLANLADEQLYKLLVRLRDWNTSARTAPVAQQILWALVRSYPPNHFIELKVGSKGSTHARLRDLIDGLVAYTERHLKKTEQLIEESYLLDFTLGEMDEVAGYGLNAATFDEDTPMG